MVTPIDQTGCRDDDFSKEAQTGEEAFSKSRYGTADLSQELDTFSPHGISTDTLRTMQTVRSHLVEEGAVGGFQVNKIYFATLLSKVVDGAIDQPCADRVDVIHASEVEMEDGARLGTCQCRDTAFDRRRLVGRQRPES